MEDSWCFQRQKRQRSCYGDADGVDQSQQSSWKRSVMCFKCEMWKYEESGSKDMNGDYICKKCNTVDRLRERIWIIQKEYNECTKNLMIVEEKLSNFQEEPKIDVERLEYQIQKLNAENKVLKSSIMIKVNEEKTFTKIPDPKIFDKPSRTINFKPTTQVCSEGQSTGLGDELVYNKKLINPNKFVENGDVKIQHKIKKEKLINVDDNYIFRVMENFTCRERMEEFNTVLVGNCMMGGLTKRVVGVNVDVIISPGTGLNDICYNALVRAQRLKKNGCLVVQGGEHELIENGAARTLKIWKTFIHALKREYSDIKFAVVSILPRLKEVPGQNYDKVREKVNHELRGMLPRLGGNAIEMAGSTMEWVKSMQSDGVHLNTRGDIILAGAVNRWIIVMNKS